MKMRNLKYVNGMMKHIKLMMDQTFIWSSSNVNKNLIESNASLIKSNKELFESNQKL